MIAGTYHATRRVGSSGRVYAEDINPSYLRYIRHRTQKDNLPNLRTILGKSDDPLLPANSVNAVLLAKATMKWHSPSWCCGTSVLPCVLALV